MTVKTAAVTVTTSATRLDTQADATRTFEGGFQSTVTVYPAAQTVYVGGSDVTTANGMPIAAGAYASFDLGPDDQLWGVVAATTDATRVLQTGV